MVKLHVYVFNRQHSRSLYSKKVTMILQKMGQAVTGDDLPDLNPCARLLEVEKPIHDGAFRQSMMNFPPSEMMKELPTNTLNLVLSHSMGDCQQIGSSVFVFLGYGPNFGMKEPEHPPFNNDMELKIVHELAHLFGCLHAPTGPMLGPLCQYKDAYNFDEDSMHVLKASILCNQPPDENNDFQFRYHPKCLRLRSREKIKVVVVGLDNSYWSKVVLRDPPTTTVNIDRSNLVDMSVRCITTYGNVYDMIVEKVD